MCITCKQEDFERGISLWQPLEEGLAAYQERWKNVEE
jgi:hypothetical protein